MHAVRSKWGFTSRVAEHVLACWMAGSEAETALALCIVKSIGLVFLSEADGLICCHSATVYRDTYTTMENYQTKKMETS